MLRKDLSLVVVSNDLDVDEASQIELLRAKQRHDELLGKYKGARLEKLMLSQLNLDCSIWCLSCLLPEDHRSTKPNIFNIYIYNEARDITTSFVIYEWGCNSVVECLVCIFFSEKNHR
jgi:hypothetical protein